MKRFKPKQVVFYRPLILATALLVTGASLTGSALRSGHGWLLSDAQAAENQITDSQSDGLSQAATDAIERIYILLDGPTQAADEREIIDILGIQTATDLNAILSNIPFEKILSDIDDHLWGQQNLHTFLDLLFDARAADLSPSTKLLMVNNLQTGSTSERDEEAIARIIQATHGKDLTDLKTGIDQGKDHRTLRELIYVDVDSEVYREAILSHISNEGAKMENQGLKILSDIDDTIYASLYDDSLPKKSIYPGVRELYKQMGNLTFLTARPFTRVGIFEAKTHSILDSMGFIDRSLLMGSVTALLNPELMGRKKALNFNIYEKLFPEYRFVFFGDSGQGDVLTATLIQRSHRERVALALIHDIRIDGPLGESKTSATERENHAASFAAPVFFFDTYTGAATELFSKHLINESQLRAVMTSSKANLEAIFFQVEAVKNARKLELDRDLVKANSLIETLK